jgi:hypothetical protein
MTRKLITRSSPRAPLSSLRWPAVRFRLLDEAGEPMDIRLRRIRLVDGAVIEAEDVRHEDHDGVGALTALLQDRGFDITAMPVVVDPQRPSLLRRLVLLRRYIAAIRGWPQRYKQEPDWSVVVGGPCPAVAVLDVDTTTALLAALKAAGAGLTAGIVSALDEAAARVLLADESPRRWMVPVNMRTSAALDVDNYANVVTSLLVPFPQAQSPAEVHAVLKDMLARHWHWGTTVVSSLFSRFSIARLRRMVGRFNPRSSIFGYVSNVGSWPPAGVADVDTDDTSTWAVIPPVGRRGPLATVLIVYRGRLAVALHAHGCLRLSDEAVADLVRTALQNLLQHLHVDGAVTVHSVR